MRDGGKAYRRGFSHTHHTDSRDAPRDARYPDRPTHGGGDDAGPLVRQGLPPADEDPRDARPVDRRPGAAHQAHPDGGDELPAELLARRVRGSRQKRLDLVRSCATELGTPVSVLGDLQGPKIRVGDIPDPGFDLPAGEKVIISVHPRATPIDRAGADEASIITCNYEASCPSRSSPGTACSSTTGTSACSASTATSTRSPAP